MNYKHFLFGFILLSLLLTACNEDNLTGESDHFAEEQSEEFIDLKRSCGHEEHMDKLLQDPNYKRAHEEKFEKLEIELSKAVVRNCSDPIIIPVAVHFQNVTGTNAACLAQLVESQIDVLNKDISGTNADINKWRSQAASYFPGISNGEACVKFCVATKNHPSGFGLSNGQSAITVNRVNGDQANAWSGYLNIFVRPNLGFLGEAPLGGSGNGDGVLIDASTFGLGSGCGNVRPEAPYNLGRTTTHEVGHYLLLDHIWGNGCNVDDGVSDTPNQASDRSGCPNLGVKSCSSNDMHMNYMDYVNDVCMYMFSAGQASRMTAYITSSLSNLVNKAGSVCDEGGGNTGGGDTGGGDTGGGDTGDGDTGGSQDQCSKVTTSTAQVLSQTRVKLNWPDVPNAINYRIRYKKQGTSSWTAKTLSPSVYTVTGLAAGTVYQYQIRVRCADGWTGFSTVKTFTTNGSGGGSSSCTKNEISFILTLDDYGSETSWELVKENGQRVAIGGPFADGQSGKNITKDFCLPDGCYTMYVDDAYGDGICCDFGNGKVRIRDENGSLIASSNGRFGTYTYLDFCVTDGLARFKGERKDEPKATSARKF